MGIEVKQGGPQDNDLPSFDAAAAAAAFKKVALVNRGLSGTKRFWESASLGHSSSAYFHQG